MTIANKLNKLLETKENIKQSIANKGVEITDDTVFAEYPSLIDSIEVGGGNSGDIESVWNIVTNNGTRFDYLLYNCNSLYSLDLSNLDTSNGTTMKNMFYNCNKLMYLTLGNNFNTSNVTNMSYMFYSCQSLTTLDVSNFDTSNVIDMANMFGYCSSLTQLDVSNFDTSNVTRMENMFAHCEKLTSLDLNHFNVGKVTSMSGMVNFCGGLTELDVSSWNVSHITGNYSLGSAFDYCFNLVDFYPPQNINTNMSVSLDNFLSHDSLMRIINNLMTITSTKTLTLGADNLAKLSSEEIAIATNKGWTVK